MMLNGWKEISNYMGRGIRTIQRWEGLGLPIRRPHGHSRSAVIAVSDEIDAWALGCKAGRDLESLPTHGIETLDQHLRLLHQLHMCIEDLKKSRQQSQARRQVLDLCLTRFKEQVVLLDSLRHNNALNRPKGGG